MKDRTKALLAVAFALLTVLSMPVGATAPLSFANSAETPEPFYRIDQLTIDDYNVSWGEDLRFHDDSGDVDDYPADINRSDDIDDIDSGHGRVNPFHILTTRINDTDLEQFPRKSDEGGEDVNKASSLDASEWTTGGAAMSDVNPAEGVEGVEYKATAAGDTATYSNFSITADASKRVVQAFYDIDSASGATVVNLTIHDATDSDTVVVHLYDSSETNTDKVDVGAFSTGEGKAIQVKISKLTGGSNIDEIGKFVIEADGSANVDFSLLAVNKKSKYVLGTKRVDSDSDDSFEKNTTYNATGRYNITSLASMDDAFDDARIEDLQMPVDAEAGDFDASMRIHTVSDAAAYPGFDKKLNITYRMELPDAIDVAYSGVSLRYPQQWPEGRYVKLEYKEAVDASTDLDEVSSLTDKSGSLSSEGSEFEVDGTISSGDDNVVRVVITLTNDELDPMLGAAGGGGGGGGPIFGGGGILGFFGTATGMVVGVAGLGIAWATGLLGKIGALFGMG